jgi:hypothetical protein
MKITTVVSPDAGTSRNGNTISETENEAEKRNSLFVKNNSDECVIAPECAPSLPEAAANNASPKFPHAVFLEGQNKALAESTEILRKALLPTTFAGLSARHQYVLPLFERPANNVWFRVHTEGVFRVITFKTQDKKRLVANALDTDLLDFLASRNAARETICYPYCAKEGAIGFWPVIATAANGRALDGFNQSAHIIAVQARTLWSSVTTGSDSYKIATLPDIASPLWPESLDELFSRAINDFFVENLRHPEMLRWQRLE